MTFYFPYYFAITSPSLRQTLPLKDEESLVFFWVGMTEFKYIPCISHLIFSCIFTGAKHSTNEETVQTLLHSFCSIDAGYTSGSTGHEE